ncbi:hypothetical protein GCM10010840_30150 [Deinococcus aerolatus]|uniref:Uncharacterized protein n=1 Tax=Deinococcus aerolatus TaxID=522487 RepID=A0ABQ2GDS1_9DEIO|nr:hypothetical protein GCM10010840_30150 [Deinococcus aerolatus]
MVFRSTESGNAKNYDVIMRPALSPPGFCSGNSTGMKAIYIYAIRNHWCPHIVQALHASRYLIRYGNWNHSPPIRQPLNYAIAPCELLFREAMDCMEHSSLGAQHFR